MDQLQKFISRVPTQNGAHLWIGGDFNLADIDWNDECVQPYPNHGAQCQQLLKTSKDAFLSQMVTEPTRTTETSASILELFFTSNDTLVNQTRVIPGISDHEAVFVESSLRPIKKPTCPRRIFKFQKADYDGFKQELKDLTPSFLEKANSLDINTLWFEFKSTIHRLMEKYIPTKTLRGKKKPKPWITKNIRALHRKRNKLYKKQKATKKRKDGDHYRCMKAKVQRAERQAYWQYVENLIEVGDENCEQRPGKQKRFWSYIKALRKDNSGVAPLKENGKMHADPLDKSNILNRQYESTFTREDETNIPQPEGQPYPPMPDIEISREGVLKLLKKINPNKASGPDMIPARILKDLAEELAPILYKLTDWERKWGMLFHPDKCNTLQVTRARNPLTFTYSLKGQDLEAVNTAKYLGVDLSNNLSWNSHIDRTTKKANSMLGFLRRNLRVNNSDTKAAAYKTLVRPNLEYCASVWSPFTAAGKRKIEMVQRRAARYATNRYHNTSSVTDMLQDLDWESLESRRVKIQLTLLFKVIQDLVDIPASTYLTPASTRTRANHTKKLRQISSKSDAYKYSFFPRTIPVWNSLPATVAEAPDLVSFKQGLSTLTF